MMKRIGHTRKTARVETENIADEDEDYSQDHYAAATADDDEAFHEDFAEDDSDKDDPEDDEVVEDESTKWGNLIRKTGTKSKIWNSFMVFENQRNIAKCQLPNCRHPLVKLAKDLKTKLSTSKLDGHIKRHHSKSHRKSLLEKAETDSTNQIAVNFTQECPGKITSHFSIRSASAGYAQAYVEWIIDNYQPLDTCSKKSFRKMLLTLNPKAVKDITLGKDRVCDILLADCKANIKIMCKDNFLLLIFYWIFLEHLHFDFVLRQFL